MFFSHSLSVSYSTPLFSLCLFLSHADIVFTPQSSNNNDNMCCVARRQRRKTFLALTKFADSRGKQKSFLSLFPSTHCTPLFHIYFSLSPTIALFLFAQISVNLNKAGQHFSSAQFTISHLIPDNLQPLTSQAHTHRHTEANSNTEGNR